jgi:hypothetical protein
LNFFAENPAEYPTFGFAGIIIFLRSGNIEPGYPCFLVFPVKKQQFFPLGGKVSLCQQILKSVL